MPTIGHVKEFPREVDLDLCASVRSLELHGKGRNGLNRLKSTTLGIELVGRNASSLFVVHVGDVLAGMKNDVPRPCVSRSHQLGHLRGFQFAKLGIKRELKDRIRPGVRHEGEPIRRIEQNRMRLLRSVDALVRHGAERAILPDAMYRDLGGDVVSAEKVTRVFIGRKMSGIGTGGHGVDVRQLARLGVDAICRQLSLGSKRGEQKPLFCIGCERSGFAVHRRFIDARQFSVRGVHPMENDFLLGSQRDVDDRVSECCGGEKEKQEKRCDALHVRFPGNSVQGPIGL